MKAQSAIEFITAYSWAFLLLLIVAFVAFYYLSAQQVPTRCDFGTDLQCPTYQFVQSSAGNMRLAFQLTNSMGKAVNLSGNQTITVTNVGSMGVNTYNGTCLSANAIIRGGDTIYCAFNLTNAAVVPSINRNIKFDVALSYTDCETSPDYPSDCIGGLNRTAHGIIIATFEARPGDVTAFCGDGNCSGGKTCATCPADCGPCGVTTCQPDCTFAGVCNSSCIGINGCGNFYPACNNITKFGVVSRCSDSSGGLTGAFNYNVSCCNGGISPAYMCYQVTSTSTSYCGNGHCDSPEENCSNCPKDCGQCGGAVCLSNCTLGDNTCHQSCNGTNGCTSFVPECSDSALGSPRCSNSTGGTAPEGTPPLLNYSVQCCNGAPTPLPNSGYRCYQNTSTTIGWCGDTYCDGSRGETCATCPTDCGACPPTCQLDCTFAGVCNSTCTGCSNVLQACNSTFGSGISTCLNSTGGSSGTINFQATCCNGSVTNCGNSSYCNSSGVCSACTSGFANCNNDSSDGCETNLSTNNSNCGSCGNVCTGGQICQNGVCISPYYQNTTNLCGYSNSPVAGCGSGLNTTYCTSGTYYPIQTCSATPTYTSCQAENSSASCAVCGDCSGGNCNAVACGTTNNYNCSGMCAGNSTGASSCIVASSLALGAPCNCKQVCASGLCSGGVCKAYTASTPNLCGYYSGNNSSGACTRNPVTYCTLGNYFPYQSCKLGSTPITCSPENSSASCAVCGMCNGINDTCSVVSCGITNNYNCSGMCAGNGTGASSCIAAGSVANGQPCLCDQACASGHCPGSVCLPACTGSNGDCNVDCVCISPQTFCCGDGSCAPRAKFCPQQ